MIQLQHSFTSIVSGPTGSGKTQFTIKLVNHASKMISPPPDEIVWCYGIYQEIFQSLTGVRFVDGLPNISEFDDSKHTLMIIDDLMHEADDRVAQLFTKGSHHKNISIVFLTQNIFHSSIYNRTMNLNSHYIVLFKNPRDVGPVGYIGRQMFAKRGAQFLSDSFEDATSRSYGYLFLDLKSNTDQQLRVRTNIFPDESPQYVYLPK